MKLVCRRQVSACETVVSRSDLIEQGCQQAKKVVRVIRVNIDFWRVWI